VQVHGTPHHTIMNTALVASEDGKLLCVGGDDKYYEFVKSSRN